jgi:hypothetical protein
MVWIIREDYDRPAHISIRKRTRLTRGFPLDDLQRERGCAETDTSKISLQVLKCFSDSTEHFPLILFKEICTLGPSRLITSRSYVHLVVTINCSRLLISASCRKTGPLRQNELKKRRRSNDVDSSSSVDLLILFPDFVNANDGLFVGPIIVIIVLDVGHVDKITHFVKSVRRKHNLLEEISLNSGMFIQFVVDH